MIFWSEPKLLDIQDANNNHPFIYQQSDNVNARMLYVTDFDGEFLVKFINLTRLEINNSDIKGEFQLKLHQPSTNIAFVRGGEIVSFELTVEAIGGMVHNTSLWVITGADELETSASQKIPILENGTHGTMTISFTVPEKKDLSTEYRTGCCIGKAQKRKSPSPWTDRSSAGISGQTGMY